MKLRIAVAQTALAHLNPEKNFLAAEGFCRKAAARRAQLIVFPEDFTTGPIRLHKELADSRGRCRERMRLLARRFTIDLVAGSVIEREGGRFYNTSYYIDRTGKVLGRYRKVHLWHSEKPYVTPGDRVVVVKSRLGRVGLSICWDLAYPELYRAMMRKGADLLVNVAYWSLEDAGPGFRRNRSAEVEFVNAAVTTRAFENEAIMIFCNPADADPKGRFPGRTLMGRSQVAAPFLGTVARLDHGRPGLLFADVDTGILRDAEKAYRLKADSGVTQPA